MLLAAVACVLVVGAAQSDPASQVALYTALLGSVGAIIGVVLKVARDGRRREKGEDSLVEQQRTELLDPMKAELARARAERDTALRQRRALLDHWPAGTPIPPEAYQ